MNDPRPFADRGRLSRVHAQKLFERGVIRPDHDPAAQIDADRAQLQERFAHAEQTHAAMLAELLQDTLVVNEGLLQRLKDS